MASTCSIYKGGILLGTGSCAAASTSITSFTATTGAPSVVKGKNINIVVTQAGSHAGRTWRSRVVSNSAGTVVVTDACPFVGA